MPTLHWTFFFLLFVHPRSSLVCMTLSNYGNRGLLSSCGAMAYLVAEHGLKGTWASGVVTCMLSSSAACGISPGKGLNLCPLHWQATSLPLNYQRSPHIGPFSSCGIDITILQDRCKVQKYLSIFPKAAQLQSQVLRTVCF